MRTKAAGTGGNLLQGISGRAGSCPPLPSREQPQQEKQNRSAERQIQQGGFFLFSLFSPKEAGGLGSLLQRRPPGFDSAIFNLTRGANAGILFGRHGTEAGWPPCKYSRLCGARLPGPRALSLLIELEAQFYKLVTL